MQTDPNYTNPLLRLPEPNQTILFLSLFLTKLEQPNIESKPYTTQTISPHTCVFLASLLGFSEGGLGRRSAWHHHPRGVEVLLIPNSTGVLHGSDASGIITGVLLGSDGPAIITGVLFGSDSVGAREVAGDGPGITTSTDVVLCGDGVGAGEVTTTTPASSPRVPESVWERSSLSSAMHATPAFLASVAEAATLHSFAPVEKARGARYPRNVGTRGLIDVGRSDDACRPIGEVGRSSGMRGLHEVISEGGRSGEGEVGGKGDACGVNGGVGVGRSARGPRPRWSINCSAKHWRLGSSRAAARAF